jgi:hypothetical protein
MPKRSTTVIRAVKPLKPIPPLPPVPVLKPGQKPDKRLTKPAGAKRGKA